METGIPLTKLSNLLGFSRSGFYKWRNRQEKESKTEQSKSKNQTVDEEIATKIKDIIIKYPWYGYRRVWANLRYDQGLIVNKKKVQRIMQIKKWQVKPLRRPSRAGREPEYTHRHIVADPTRKIAVDSPNLRWSSDLTKFYVEECGWANFIPVIDCCTRECVGKRISVRGRAREARDALEDAVISIFGSAEEVPEDMLMRLDNGSIFLAREYREELKRLGITPEFTPYRCPSANGIAERFMRTFKEECAWIHCFKTLSEAEETINRWIDDYNHQRRHSSLGYMTPVEYRKSLRKLAA